MLNQKVIPALSTIKLVESFIKTDKEYCILLNFHINHLSYIIKLLHKHNKKVFVHSGMIKGLASDSAAIEFLAQTLKVDGIIATKASSIITAKKNNILTIQRIFLIDSTSFKKGISLVNECEPDMVELLPGISYRLIDLVKEHIKVPIIGGGLITSHEIIDECLQAGMMSVSVSKATLWK